MFFARLFDGVDFEGVEFAKTGGELTTINRVTAAFETLKSLECSNGPFGDQPSILVYAVRAGKDALQQ